MNAKEELSQYKFKKKRVSEALEEYMLYKERAEKMTAIISETTSRTNINSDKVGDNAIKMADLDKEYQVRWLQAEKERIELLNKLDSLDDPYRTLLVARYIHEKPFEQIAFEMNYSYDWTVHLHGEALKLYKTKLDISQQDKTYNNVQ